MTHKVPYLPIYGHFHEVVEFQIVDKTEGREVKSLRNTRMRAKEAEEETTKQPQSLIPINNFELYVIHHCQPLQKEGQESMRWESVGFTLFSLLKSTIFSRRATENRPSIRSFTR